MTGIRGMLRTLAMACVLSAAMNIAAAGQGKFFAHLSGSEETPPVVTDASGDATVKISDDRSEIFFSVSFAGIDPANITNAHIHVGPPGVAGPVIFDLLAVQPLPGPFLSPIEGTLTAANLTPQPGSGVATFEDALAKLASGETYVNVHTGAFPDGEIRGQLGRVVKLKVRKAINPRSHGVVMVWLLSTPSFDPLTVDPATVTFGRLGAFSTAKTVDGNEDGRPDLRFKYRTQEIGIQCGDQLVTLEGATFDGLLIEGVAHIKTPGCHGGSHGGGNGDGED